MRSMALDRRPDGSVSIFHHGRQYRREPGSSGRWLKRMVSGWREVSEHRARRLERVYQQRDELKQVKRFQRGKVQEVFHLEDRGGGAATIYLGNRVWKRVLTKNSSDTAEWFRSTSEDRLVPAAGQTARALEYAYRHPKTTVPVFRSPRINLPLEINQPVYCPEFGFGEIVTINQDDITVRFGKKERRIEKTGLVTRAKAEIAWHEYWLTGEKRRLGEGKRLLIVKRLCWERHGEWQAFLNRYNIPRSTADDLIRRYLNEMARKSPSQQLTGYRSIDLSSRDYATDVATGEKNATELDELIHKEIAKRDGRKPTHHESLWSIRIKLPQDILRRCRKKYKRPSAKEYWRKKAYEFVGVEPEVETES
jgi:hypothetical protein